MLSFRHIGRTPTVTDSEMGLGKRTELQRSSLERRQLKL